MSINLSVKNVPEEIAARIRRRAARHHRSLQGELMAILEEIVSQENQLTPEEFLGHIRGIGVKTPPEAAKTVRRDRDARARR